MDEQQVTREQFVIDQMAREIASLKVEVANKNFTILALKEKIRAGKEDEKASE